MQKRLAKSEKLDGKAMLLAVLAALVCAVPLRTVQLFTNIEPNTGFFAAIDWTVYTVYGVLLVGTVVLLLLPMLSSRLPASRPVIRKSYALTVGGFFLAVGIAYDVLVCAMRISNTIANELGRTELFALLFTNGLLALLLQAVCGAAACVYFVFFALSYLKGNAVFCKYKLLGLMPLFWTLFRLVSRFMTKISFTILSELLIELAMLSFMALFMMSFARVSAGINQKGEMQKCIRYGLPAAFLALTIGISRLVCTVGGNAEVLPDGFAFALADLGFGVFAVLYIFEHMQYGRPASEDAQLAAEADEPNENPADTPKESEA